VCVVPLGVSRHNSEAAMRPHTVEEAAAVVDLVESWQRTYERVLGRRLVYLADEYYLLCGRDFAPAESYDGFPMHEDGVGMARAFELEFRGVADDVMGVRPGFFAWVDGAPAEGYRAPRLASSPGSVVLRPRRGAPVGILTGPLGARVVEPLVRSLGRDDVRVIPVPNEFFGGNTGVTGLMVGEDVARVLAVQPEGHRYLLPDVCLTGGVFLDGVDPASLPRPVEIVATDGRALREAIG
jgi:NifB/MoaA-like Fe-S oxidoreductase